MSENHACGDRMRTLLIVIVICLLVTCSQSIEVGRLNFTHIATISTVNGGPGRYITEAENSSFLVSMSDNSGFTGAPMIFMMDSGMLSLNFVDKTEGEQYVFCKKYRIDEQRVEYSRKIFRHSVNLLYGVPYFPDVWTGYRWEGLNDGIIRYVAYGQDGDRQEASVDIKKSLFESGGSLKNRESWMTCYNADLKRVSFVDDRYILREINLLSGMVTIVSRDCSSYRRCDDSFAVLHGKGMVEFGRVLQDGRYEKEDDCTIEPAEHLRFEFYDGKTLVGSWIDPIGEKSIADRRIATVTRNGDIRYWDAVLPEEYRSFGNNNIDNLINHRQFVIEQDTLYLFIASGKLAQRIDVFVATLPKQ